MSRTTLHESLAAAQRGEPVTVTLDAETLKTLARFWAERQRARKRWRPGRDVPPEYRGDPALVKVLWLAAGDAEKAVLRLIDAAAALAGVER